MMSNITGYGLSKDWFNFTSNNPDLVRPVHTALFFYLIELWNRFGKRDKFGVPTDYTMGCVGIRSRKTYYQALGELENFGFIDIVEKSRNQNSANIISISACVKNAPADTLAPTLADAQPTTPPTTHIYKLLNKEVVRVIEENHQLLNEKLSVWVDAWKNKQQSHHHTETITEEISRGDFIQTAERVNTTKRIISRDHIMSYCDNMTSIREGKMKYTKYLPLHLPSSMRMWLGYPENKGKGAKEFQFPKSLDLNPK